MLQPIQLLGRLLTANFARLTVKGLEEQRLPDCCAAPCKLAHSIAALVSWTCRASVAEAPAHFAQAQEAAGLCAVGGAVGDGRL